MRESPPAQQTQDIFMTFMQCQSRANVLCLLGDNTSLGVKQFPNPRSNTVSLFEVGDQVGAKDKGFELLTHRCRSSIYELAVI